MRKSLAMAALAACLVSPFGAGAQGLDIDNMTPAQRAAFGEQIRAYLLENPEVIFEAIQILEERREMAGAQADIDLVRSNQDEIFNDGFSFVGGNPDGDVTIVEFLDYRCGYCKRAHPDIEELLDRDPNVRLVVKEFPILGPDSVKAGKMALAALSVDPARFKDLNNALMSYEGALTEQVAYRLAGDVGYDIAALKDEAGSTEVDDRLNRNYQLAQTLGLQGTPAFIVGEQIIRGYLPVDDMMDVVNKARASN